MAKKKLENNELKTVDGGMELNNEGAFYRYVMLDKSKYKCNSCGHTWEDTPTPSACPSCKSTNISKNQ